MREYTKTSGCQGREQQAGNFRLSLVIPAWNEADTIRQAILEAQAALAATVAEYEIIVVDDGSTDATGEIVRAEAAADSHVRLVQQAHNLGYGAALRTGFLAATLDLVAFTDADCQFDLHELSYLLPLSRHYDLTCGYRIDRQDPARRRFLSWGYNTLVKLLLGSPVHDIDCALKIFHREQLASILPECNNFFVNTEMLTRAGMQGLSIVEVGVHHRPRLAGQSKVSLLDVPKTLGALLPFWWSQVLFPANQSPQRKQGTSAGRWAWAGLAAILVFAAALLFLNLSYPLIEPDEGRYAEIGREMLSSGDWIVPTLNQQPYLDKPPLFYWLLAGSFGIFGKTEQAARLVPVLAALFTVIGTFWFGKRMMGARAAFLSALALTVMAGFTPCGRFLILDSVLTVFVAGSLFTAHEAVQGERLRWPWWLASAVFCALGVLTKGPIALVMLAPPVVAFIWLSRNRVRLTLVPWCIHVGLMLVLIAPWFIAICWRHPEFAREYFLSHHLKRFFSGEYHDSPVWFYVPVLFLGCLPWSLLVFSFTRFLFSRSIAVRSLRIRPMGFFLLWAGWCVLFFSLSRGKLPPYLLPALPAIALLLGYYLEQVLFQPSLATFCQKASRVVPQWTILILSGTWLLINLFAWQKGWVEAKEAIVWIMAGLCLLGLVVAGWGRSLPPKFAWAACCAVAAVLLLETTQSLVPAWSCQRSLLNQPEEIAGLLRNPNLAVGCYEGCGSVSFSLDRSNARNFNSEGRQELSGFVRQNSRALLILTSDFDRAWVRRFVPEEADIDRIIGGRKAWFVLVHFHNSPSVKSGRVEEDHSTVNQVIR